MTPPAPLSQVPPHSRISGQWRPIQARRAQFLPCQFLPYYCHPHPLLAAQILLKQILRNSWREA